MLYIFFQIAIFSSFFIRVVQLFSEYMHAMYRKKQTKKSSGNKLHKLILVECL